MRRCYHPKKQSVLWFVNAIIFALDKDTGKKLWEFNIGTSIGIVGPSVGHGMLFVSTGQTFTIGANSGGGVIVFGLPKSK